MNPFKGDFPINDRSDWAGSQRIFEELNDCICQRTNTCIMGVMGSGKTSLLNCFFTINYKREMALKKKILIISAELSTRKDGEDVCEYLADQLKYSIRHLLRENDNLNTILEEIHSIESRSAKTSLQLLMNILNDYHYFVVIVMDSFELFTSSQSITMEHHEQLRSLIESRRLQCIVATNYDLQKDSLQREVKGSFYLQKFTNFLQMEPFTEEEAFGFLSREQENSDICLDEKVIKILYRISGGIPQLLKMSAVCAYDNMKENAGVLNGKKMMEDLYKICRPTFKEWCKVLTLDQAQVLKSLAAMANADLNRYASYDFTGESLPLRNAVETLKSRGILRKRRPRLDEKGNLISGQDYEVEFNSLLFQQYCGSEDLVEEATRRDFSHEPSVGQPGGGNITNIINIYTGITPTHWLDLLGSAGTSRQSFAQSLLNELDGMIKQLSSFSVGELRECDQADESIHKIEQNFFPDVEVDEDMELKNVSASQLQTLDDRFEEARSRCRPALTDEILNLQSEQCRFYLKLSVVVEDALNFTAMEDYSPQLVLYGKTLEQALRDNFYDLFHMDQELSVYSSYTHMNDKTSREVFLNKVAAMTYIGNYEHLIAGKIQYLGELCLNYGAVLTDGSIPTSWEEWWEKLRRDICKAREIRNLTDHANRKSPSCDELEQMCLLLMGNSSSVGILERISLGKQLNERLFTKKIPYEAICQLEGKVTEVKCIEVKTNGGIRGITCEGGYSVNISPKKVQKFRNGLAESDFSPEGCVFQVRLLEYRMQGGREFFSGELCAQGIE